MEDLRMITENCATTLNVTAPRRILIIGGTRFIGPPVVRLLVRSGHEVTLFHRGTTEADLPPGVTHVHGDRKDLFEYQDAMRNLAPDVVIDMVAHTGSDADALVAVFRGVAGRLVVISSCDVYRTRDRLFGIDPGPPEPMPRAEDSPLRSHLYPYRTSGMAETDPKYHYEKILVEEIVQQHEDLPVTVLRLPAVYGPGDFQHRTFEYLKRMEDRRDAILIGESQLGWRWSRGYVENVAAAIALAATHPAAAGRVYNVGDEPTLTIKEWVEHIGRAAAWKGQIRGVPDGDLPAHLRTEGMDWRQDWVVDTGRIRRELGYVEPIGPGDAFDRTIRWQRDHSPPVDPSQFDYAAEDLALTHGCAVDGRT
jgi:nucleoside-diphosphate-sugar epimerase